MQSRKSYPKWLIGMLCAFFWLILWTVVSAIIGKEVILPSPIAVIKSWGLLFTLPQFYYAIFSSLLRITIGFGVGCIVGVAIAISMHNFAPSRPFFAPILLVIRATPVASFILIARVWIERGHIPSFIAALMVIPIVCSNMVTAMKEMDPQLKEMVAIYNISFSHRLKYFYLPSVMPYFSACAVTSFGLAWKAGIAAEVLYPPQNSLGRALQDAKAYMETADLFAYTITVVLCSLACEKLLSFVIDTFFCRHKKRGGELE